MEISSVTRLAAENVRTPIAEAAKSAGKQVDSGTKTPVVDSKAAPKVEPFEGQDVEKAIESLQAYVQSLGRDLSFHRDETIDRSIITVRDANTNQLVRQIPAEEVIEVARQIEESMEGLKAGLFMEGKV